MNTKEYIIDRLYEFDPTLDLSDSSALVDLLVNPASAMLDPVMAQLNYLISNLGLSSPEDIPEEELDAIAKNFLKYRKQGAKAVGVVELFYNNPINLNIPKGTTFTSSAGLVFETSQDIFIPLANMAANTWNFPRYSTGPIGVVAQEYGVISSIAPNDIRVTNLVPAPAQVTNPSSFSGGVDRESNIDFIGRLIDEVITTSLGSSAGIKANLAPAYPSITQIKTRGMNDIEMLRDLVYSGIQVYSNYYNADYYGKISGLNEPPFPQSIAYWNVFYDDPTTSGLIDDLPVVGEFTDQFSTSMYGGIYDLNDALKTTVQTLIVLKDDFQAPTLDPAWILSDSITGLGLMKDQNEFLLTTVSGTQMFRLGNRLSPDDWDARGVVSMTQAGIYNILNWLQMVQRHPFGITWQSKIWEMMERRFERYQDILDFILADDNKDNNMLTPQERELWALMRGIADAATLENNFNFYPLATRTLAKHAGITVTGRFLTDDTSTEGRLSYVTVLRDDESIDPTNGFGFAWMKNDASNSIYNVYIVDNSTLANDLFVSPTFIVQNQGENPFRSAAKIDIKADKFYRYKMVIGSDYSMLVKIWLDGEAEPSDVDPDHTLTAGAPLNVTADGTHIGFGVMGTKNSQWFYDDLLVENNAGVHSAVLYRLKADPAEFPNGTLARVNHYGYGYDGVTYGLSAFIKHFDGAAWEWVEIGTNTSTNVSDREVTRVAYDFTMGTAYRDTDNFIDVLITSTEAQTTVTEVTSYYVNLETGIPSGVHTGGCADIYINDPSSILVAEQTINNVTGNLILDSSNGFLGPIHSIVEVQTALIGESLIENSDWTLITTNAATAFSTQEYPYLAFTTELVNTKVKVIYRYYAYGQEIQDRIESDEYRYSGSSNLAKIMPPVVVRINTLNYRGSMTVPQAQAAIAGYVNSQLESVSRNDIINTLYTAGASFVDLTTVDIEIIEHNYKRETQDPVQLVDEYVKPDLSAFFTDTYEMNGVLKI